MAMIDEQTRQARAQVRRALLVAGLVALLLLAALVWAGHQTGPAPAGTDPSSTADGGAGDAAAGPGGPSGPSGPGGPGGWDVVAEAALATRTMTVFPESAATPQPLAASTRAPVVLPAATGFAAAEPSADVGSVRVASGFPPTAVGAVAQLVALHEVSLSDLNPATYTAAYRTVALLGAPNPAVTPLGSQVGRLYDQLVTASSTPTPITSRWQPGGALLKGSTDGGRYVLVCVVGELQLAQANTAVTTAADCQGMRWTGTEWRISPGPPAAPAPITWPGSEAFNRAGYQPLTATGSADAAADSPNGTPR